MADNYVISKATLDGIAVQTMALNGSAAAMTTEQMRQAVADANTEVAAQAAKIATISGVLAEKGSTSNAVGETAATPIAQNTADLDALIEKARALPETVEQATPTISVSSAGLITASATQAAGRVAAGTKTATKQLPVETWTLELESGSTTEKVVVL